MNPVFVEFEGSQGERIVINASTINYMYESKSRQGLTSILYSKELGVFVKGNIDEIRGKIEDTLRKNV